MNYKNADMSVLADEMKDCQKRLDEYVKSGISLDLSRGKPSAEQLELSLKMLDVLAFLTAKTEQTAVITADLTVFLRLNVCWLILWVHIRRIQLSAETVALQ